MYLSRIVAIARGGYHSLALRRDGTVWAWGDNTQGELGDGTTISRPAPVRVAGLSGIVAIAGGLKHNMAVKKDGTVWVWGYNVEGEVGAGATSPFVNVPVRVKGLTGVAAIAAGNNVCLAATKDGALWAWGGYNENEFGEVGIGTTGASVLVPTQVRKLTRVTAIAAGNFHCLAIQDNEPAGPVRPDYPADARKP
jgi:alpha-tubulin suppressor-like RCC1 family protein